MKRRIQTPSSEQTENLRTALELLGLRPTVDEDGTIVIAFSVILLNKIDAVVKASNGTYIPTGD
jgi:hypothetical protein